MLGEDLSDQRVVEKILVCLPEMFEVLEKNKNFSEITVAELVNALQAYEQRRSLRMEENVEGAFLASKKAKIKALKVWEKEVSTLSILQKRYPFR